MFESLTARALFLILGLSLIGCTGAIGQTASDTPGAPGAGGAGSPATPGSAPPTGSPTAASCSAPRAGKSPLRRLTRREFNNTIRDLLGAAPLTVGVLGIDEKSHVFDSNSRSPISELQASRYAETAATLASAAVTPLSAGAGCDLTRSADAASVTTCADKLITGFGLRAYRRPLTPAEVASYQKLFKLESAAGGMAAGIRIVVETMLQSPHFLYRVEIGAPASGSAAVAPLSPFEVATRLSYFLWATTPDASLLDAAAGGRLATPEGLEREVRRLLADPRAADALISFQGQWLDLEDLPALGKDAKLFPGWNAALATAMQKETEQFAADNILRGDGRLATLLLAPSKAVPPELAKWYGDKPRAGLLTQGALLSRYAHEDQTSPVRRGMLVREGLLCQTPPPPPPDVDDTPPAVDPNVSTRERFAMHRNNPKCAACHTMLDPIGFGFEGFDAAGRGRTQDGKMAIDDSGELVGTDVDGPFRGPVELAERLAKSTMVRDCMATHWMEFALGPLEAEDVACAMRAATERFTASNMDIRELVVAIAGSDAFRNVRLK